MKCVGLTSMMPGTAGGFTMAVFDGREVPIGARVFVQTEEDEVKRKFIELPLGTKFRYNGGAQVWVVIDRKGLGTIASYEEDLTASAGQMIYTFGDTLEEVRDTEVIVVK